jgi:Kef-type K+ transport system membrane component KefB
MSDIWLLLGLLVLAYTGSILAGGRAIRGYGLPSSAEYLLLGFVLGPHVLDVAQRSIVASFQPIAVVGLGWLSLVVGVDYGMVGNRRVRPSRLIGGMLASLTTAFAVAAAAGAVGYYLLALRGASLWVLAGGVGLALAETTRLAVRWVVERHEARGPLAELLADLANADDAVPLTLLAVLFALAPGGPAIALPYRIALPIGAGVLLGLLTALLLRYERRLHESWGLLIGVALLGAGLASGLGLSTLSLMFWLGLTLTLASPRRDEMRAMVDVTERAVLLPLLLLAGATVDVAVGWKVWILIVAAIAARVVMRQLIGFGVALVQPSARASSGWIGLGGLASGSLTISVGLACAFELGSPHGGVVLLTACVGILLGELFGPTSLRRALERAGELPREPEPELSSEQELEPS